MKKIFYSSVLFLLLSFSLNCQLNVLHDFSITEGNLHTNYKGMLLSSGDYLYGMTPQGGSYNFGTIYKVKSDGTDFQKLFDFNGTNGQYPRDGLITDGTYLYGTTREGGDNDFGSVFKIKLDGTNFQKLKDFDPANDGATKPSCALLKVGEYLYGTTEYGGVNSNGTVFKLKTDGTDYQLIFSCSSTNISYPKGSLIFDGSFLYGMSSLGGVNNKGAIFKIKPNGNDFQILLHFDVSNGQVPIGSLLLLNNNLFGMTSGGTFETGVIFKIETDGSNYMKLHEYDASTFPAYGGNLIFDGTSLYGLTFNEIFRIELDGSNFDPIHTFSAPSLFHPTGSMIYTDTYFYGLTKGGGTNNKGGVFRFKECETIIPTIINNSGTLTTSQTYSTYQWYFDGSLISGAEQSSYTPSESGDYSVNVTTDQGCSGSSDSYNVTISNAGIDDINQSRLVIYPNPANSIVTITGLKYGVNILIKDYTGKIVLNTDVTNSELKFDISNLSNGIYIVQVANDERISKAKLVISK